MLINSPSYQIASLAHRRNILRTRGCALRTRRGTTLVEVLVSTMLVGLVLYTSLTASATLHMEQTAVIVRSQVEAEAMRILEEIRGLAYKDPELTASEQYALGRENGEAPSIRTSWDDVDDCLAYNVASLKGRDGRPLAGGRSMSCAIDVSWVEVGTLQPSANETGLKLVTITIRDQSGEEATVQGLFSALQMVPEGWSASYEITLTNSNGQSQRAVASPRNHVIGVEDLTL